MAFFIRAADSSITLEMDATVSHSHTQTGSVTQYAVEAVNGGNKASNYTQAMDTFSYSGVVSDVKYAGRQGVTLSLEDFERGITNLKKSGVPFVCGFSNALGEFSGCLFNSLVIKSTTALGKYSKSISFTIQQIEQVDVAEVTTLPVPAEFFKDPSEEKTKGSGATQDATDDTEDTLLKSAIKDLLVTYIDIFT
jgi:hypothetical protein